MRIKKKEKLSGLGPPVDGQVGCKIPCSCKETGRTRAEATRVPVFAEAQTVNQGNKTTFPSSRTANAVVVRGERGQKSYDGNQRDDEVFIWYWRIRN